MMSWSPAAVLREAQEWVWAPPGTDQVRTDWCRALRRPGADQLSVAWVDLDASSDETWTRLVDLAAEQGCRTVSISVTDSRRPADFEDYLRDRGAELTIAHQVMAWDLTGGHPDLAVPEGIEVEVINSVDSWVESTIVACEVWGGEPVTESQRAAKEVELARPIRDRGGFQVLARHDGQPAATAGVTLAGPVARMWGACTSPAHRRRGAYRATVAERLRVAARQGATLGLVNAKDDTSAPILARLGFTGYGSTRTYRLDAQLSS